MEVCGAGLCAILNNRSSDATRVMTEARPPQSAPNSAPSTAASGRPTKNARPSGGDRDDALGRRKAERTADCSRAHEATTRQRAATWEAIGDDREDPEERPGKRETHNGSSTGR